MTTGYSVETQDFLTKESIALSSYALTCVDPNCYFDVELKVCNRCRKLPRLSRTFDSNVELTGDVNTWLE